MAEKLSPTPYTCPFCTRDTTITENDVHLSSTHLDIDNADGLRKATIMFIVCPNPSCKKFALRMVLEPFKWEERFDVGRGSYNVRVVGKVLQTWMLIPPSQAKVYPGYVPEPIRNDYTEACAIKELSPKASATLSRRCLQGMIRDFWGIKKARLIDEIEELKTKVEPETWKAIDALRNLGNIGAHMEKDINVILDVDEDEAGKLIWLIELLIRDWYIARHERQERLKQIVAAADSKKTAKAAAPITKPTK